jgi:HSP20 family protein
MIRIDEYREDGVLVVKAGMPGLDPEKDVELTVTDHVLRIVAQRHEEQTGDAA